MSDLFVVSSGSKLLPIRPPAEILPNAIAIATEQPPLIDGVLDKGRIIYRGVEYGVKLSDREVTFLRIALLKDEIPLALLFDTKGGSLWRERFNNSPRQRNLVCGILTELNAKMLNTAPRIPLEFRLPRFAESIQREESSRE
jgi:hypothetical protein